jgi:hypothetical protein
MMGRLLFFRQKKLQLILGRAVRGAQKEVDFVCELAVCVWTKKEMQKIYVEMVDRRISRTYIDWFYN